MDAELDAVYCACNTDNCNTFASTEKFLRDERQVEYTVNISNVKITGITCVHESTVV